VLCQGDGRIGIVSAGRAQHARGAMRSRPTICGIERGMAGGIKMPTGRARRVRESTPSPVIRSWIARHCNGW
jgi:hypothetical protein